MTEVKWCVQIFGKVPDEVEVEAESKEEAINLVLVQILEELDLEAQPAEEGGCQPIGGYQPQSTANSAESRQDESEPAGSRMDGAQAGTGRKAPRKAGDGL